MLARYSIVAIVLHWLIALALACELGLGFALPEAPAGFALWQLHKSIGIAILALTILRIGWRLLHKPPASIETGVAALLARAAHLAFYALLLLAPLTGWAIVSTSPTKIPTILFGLVPFPNLPLAGTLNAPAEQVHEVLAWLALGLIALHIAGVVRHDLLLRHRSLPRMSPGGAAGLGALLGLVVVAAGFATFLATGGARPAARERAAPIVPPAASPKEESPASAEPASPVPTETASDSAELPAWTIAPGGRLAFSVANGADVIHGSFAKWGGTIRFDPERPSDPDITIKVDLASATVGDATQDKMLAGEEYFSTAAFPQAVMRIASARRTGAGSYAAKGTLELKGVSRPQTVTFRLSGTGRTRHVEGNAAIARAPFKLGTGETGATLAPTVDVTFSFDAETQTPAD
ncbi:MAG TPA: cytochrome b/b6 domain-containing protein [Sphingomonadaceae bacterium]